ncbi:MAG: epimerase, partial [Chloroflexi bacterium]
MDQQRSNIATLHGERFLVTGALGCIGAWSLRHLVRAGAGVVATDLSTEPTRPRLIMSPEELEQVSFQRLDVTDLAALRHCVEQERITRIIHLAGVLIPGCIANPPLGARVNVEGTVNVLETVRRSNGAVRGVSYASSLAVLGTADLYPERPIADDVLLRPHTLYGTYKMAAEHAARLYWETWQVASIGLRPSVVYGVGRDTGLTSDATKAIVAAVAGRPFQFSFSGGLGMQYAPD